MLESYVYIITSITDISFVTQYYTDKICKLIVDSDLAHAVTFDHYHLSH